MRQIGGGGNDLNEQNPGENDHILLSCGGTNSVKGLECHEALDRVSPSDEFSSFAWIKGTSPKTCDAMKWATLYLVALFALSAASFVALPALSPA